eukprot:TRINITY_DN23328_c0_g1_i1.p1 TRINITY_DN23328_c0_g1~~TRINITY_DN23328_c0_g1_i1.p1  ORF type:complete len:100 (-),score=13.03 TRINITY_DN23328_c0_g1_i1:116-415(-)
MSSDVAKDREVRRLEMSREKKKKLEDDATHFLSSARLFTFATTSRPHADPQLLHASYCIFRVTTMPRSRQLHQSFQTLLETYQVGSPMLHTNHLRSDEL